MEWRDSFLDLMLIPLSLLLPVAYHAWLWRAVRLRPLRTALGINSTTRRLWVISMMKDNGKHAVTVVQSLRNVIMGSTLMATTAILFCTGIAAVLSSTYTIKKPLSDTVFGAHGEYMMALKYVALLLLFLFAFLCHTLAICFLNQASFLINTANSIIDSDGHLGLPDTRDYIGEVLERGFTLNFVGNRLFYAGVPLLLWIFGPLLALLSSMLTVPILYNLDIVSVKSDTGCVNGKSAEFYAPDANSVYLFPRRAPAHGCSQENIAPARRERAHIIGSCGLPSRARMSMAPDVSTATPRPALASGVGKAISYPLAHPQRVLAAAPRGGGA